ncbi:MAG TPA: hypothetical protein VKB92_01555 [Myxococcales bacterium]|nr:hypothetical protein [Myxococcales bacterium]
MTPTLLLAASVFLNGVNIDGVRGQSFEKCRAVRIDDKGNVQLDCPGYQAESAGGSGSAAVVLPSIPVAGASFAPTSLAKHYFLVTEQNDGAAAQYDIDVYVNSKWVRKVRSGDEQIVLDITKFLLPGANKVLFAATKRAQKAGAASSFVRFIVGEGESSGAQILIDNPLLECKRTAAETDNVNEEFTVQAR